MKPAKVQGSELTTSRLMWDDRFVLSRLSLGVAAGCWILAGVLFAWAPPSDLVPPVLAPAIFAVTMLAFLFGRLDRQSLLIVGLTSLVAGFGWWMMQFGGTPFVLLLSSPLSGVCLWHTFRQCQNEDPTGLLQTASMVSAGSACCVVIACGAWAVSLWGLREIAGVGHPGINGILLWPWMLASLWCSLRGAQAVLAIRKAAAENSGVQDHLEGIGAAAALGVMFVPWTLGAGTLFLEAASQGPFDDMLYPERTTPLWIAIVPGVIGISAASAARVLYALLTLPQSVGQGCLSRVEGLPTKQGKCQRED